MFKLIFLPDYGAFFLNQGLHRKNRKTREWFEWKNNPLKTLVLISDCATIQMGTQLLRKMFSHLNRPLQFSCSLLEGFLDEIKRLFSCWRMSLIIEINGYHPNFLEYLEYHNCDAEIWINLSSVNSFSKRREVLTETLTKDSKTEVTEKTWSELVN